MSASYEIRECTEAACRGRFPAAVGQLPGDRCPWCGGPTQIVHQLAPPAEAVAGHTTPPPVTLPTLVGLLDNVRSLFNVGSIFRSADGAGLRHLHLCGVTPTPAQRKLAKTALGAEQYITWSHHRNSVLLADGLLADGWTLWALETSADAVSILDAPSLPPLLVLVVGSEVTGIDPDLLARCAQCVAIPMAGRKQSLNVATAFGVAAVLLRNHALR